jgi:aldehyde dehydrogenase (NAD+)
MSDLPQYRNLIGGELVPAASGAVMDTVNPATGEVWAQVPRSATDDAHRAVEAAKAAFPAWAALPPEARGEQLKKVAEVFRTHGDELARLESTDNGNPLAISQLACGSLMAVLWDRKAHETLEASTGRTVQLDAKTLGLTLREPYGVVAAIVPFNMPVAMLSNKVGTALAAGNTVVVKPPEQASVACLRLGELLAGVLPAGVVNIVSGMGEDVGDALVRHPAVAKVTMTGSSATARMIQKAAADTLTPSVFELGGKSPNIVLDDADLDEAAVGVTLMSVFTFNAGQACVAGSRILVQRSVLDDLLPRIEDIAKATKIGDPFDDATGMGPLINQEQYDKVVDHIASGVRDTELLFGGRHGAELVPERPGGYWVEPTLFLAKDNSPRICQEEVFGPVAVVIPFDTDDEAIALANDSRYGLAAGVWSRDLTRIHRYIREIESGNVWVNTYLQTRFELPFAGVKDSGYGHDEVADFSREKAAVIAIPRNPADGAGTNSIFGQPLGEERR